MGTGINPIPKGKQIAYTAGTGVLVFLDLVAFLLIKLIEVNGGPSIVASRFGPPTSSNDTIKNIPSEGSEPDDRLGTIRASNLASFDLSQFSFELHTSFSSKEEAIGLELIQLLV